MKLKLKYLSLFHLNKISSSKSFDGFQSFDKWFESRLLKIILKCESLNINISLQNYVIEQTLQNQLQEEYCYILTKKKKSYKTLPDLMIYNVKKLESTFIEVIFDCWMYMHTSMYGYMHI